MTKLTEPGPNIIRSMMGSEHISVKTVEVLVMMRLMLAEYKTYYFYYVCLSFSEWEYTYLYFKSMYSKLY